jgi:lipopolysaccharide exporter
VSGSFAVAAVQLGSGALGDATPAGLVHGSVAGSTATCVVLGAELGRHDRRRLLGGQRIGPMVASALRYRKFPLVSTWAVLLNSISWQLPALLLGYFFDSAVVGFYALGFRMLLAPMGLVGSAIGQVFFQRAARARHEGQLADVVQGVFDATLNIMLMPMAILGVAGPDIFSTILGPEWREAGVYAQILALWTLVWVVSTPLHDLFSVLELQGLGLWMDTLIFVSRFASLAVGGWLGSARLAVALFAATGIPVYGYMALVAMSRAGVDRGKILSRSARRFAGVVPACAALLLLEYLSVASWIVMACAAGFILTTWALLFARYRSGKLRPPQPAGE